MGAHELARVGHGIRKLRIVWGGGQPVGGAGHVKDIPLFHGHALDNRLRQNQTVRAAELSDFCGFRHGEVPL